MSLENAHREASRLFRSRRLASGASVRFTALHLHREGLPSLFGFKDVVMTAADYLPLRHSLASLRKAAKECEGCDLCHRGTQTVFGEGPS
jgi:hypothetical protein